MRTKAKPEKTQQTTSSNSTVPARGQSGRRLEMSPILYLQRTIGNQAVQRLLQAEPDDLSRIPAHASVKIQPKLAISTPGDVDEQQADRIADQAMASPAHTAVSCAPPCIRRFSLQSNEQTDAAPASVDQALAVPGKPLQPELRQDMEQRFGYNFSRVRVHSGAIAEQSARDVSAQAYTVGPDLVFGAGRFAPGTTEGRRLIAHELTHVVQQSHAGQHTGPSTLKLHRFGESEHKKLGNLAKTKFPYFAKLASDEVALRSSPKGRRRDNEFHNLVASLREDVRLLVVGNVSKWMRVMAQSGTALDGTTNKPINAAGLTGYVSEELLVKEPGVFDQDLPVLPGLILTYGDFTALGGDHFDEFSKLEGKAKSPGGADKIKMFVDVVAGKRKGEFEDPNTIDKEWADRYKDLAFKNVSHFSHGGTALDTWKRHHYDALMTAAKAGYFSNIDSLQRAYAINGFADHFLTDSFSSGHVRVPRMKILKFYEDFFNQNLDSILNYIYTSIGDQMMTQLFEDHPNVTGLGLMSEHDFCADNKEAVVEFKNQVEKEMKDNNLQPKDLRKLLVQYIGGAVSKVLHDDDNTSGLEVKSKKHPEGWKAFGDGKLNPSFQNYIVEAVEVSKTEVAQAFNIGIDFKKNTGDMKLEEKIKPLVYPASNVEDYIPETNTSKSTPLPEWKIDLTGWDTMDKSVQDKLTVLIKKYLDDKTLEAMIAKIPRSVEKEVDWSPNVNVRPRDATRHVLLQFRDNPVDFITSAALTPKDFQKALDKVVLCRTLQSR